MKIVIGTILLIASIGGNATELTENEHYWDMFEKANSSKNVNIEVVKVSDPSKSLGKRKFRSKLEAKTFKIIDNRKPTYLHVLGTDSMVTSHSDWLTRNASN